MATDIDNHDLIDGIYTVAMEPERFRELVDIWQEQLDAASRDRNNFPVITKNFELFERHVTRAGTVLALISDNEELLPLPLLQKLNSGPQAMMALSMDGVIEAQNMSAETLYGIDIGAKINQLPISPKAINTLYKGINRLAHLPDTQEPQPPGLFRLERDKDETPLVITLSPWTTVGGQRYVLLKTTDLVWPEHLTPLIEKAFGLTSAESNIVKLIVEGQSVETIATTRGTSVKTVRFQIRSIYDKTHTTNQSEFIRMAIGLTTLDLVNKDTLNDTYQRSKDISIEAYPYQEHRHLLSLPDGRILDYADFGPKDGKPCVFFHNEYFGDVFPTPLAQALIEKNLRMIIPARAFYGRSSPAPVGAVNYEQTTIDFDILLTRLGISKSVHLSQTLGGSYSLAYAAKHPRQVAALVGVSPMLPLGSAQDEKDMSKFPRFISSIVHRHPKMLDFIVRSGTLYHKRVGSKRFLETIVCHTEPDKKIVNDLNNLDAIIRGFQFGSQHGTKAYLYDFRNFPPDASAKIMALACPTYVIIGTHDSRSRVARAEHLIKAGANMEIIMAEGGGNMLFFSHPALIADTLAKAWEQT